MTSDITALKSVVAMKLIFTRSDERSFGMISKSENGYRRWWRAALLLLVVLPFVPEIVILATSVLARLSGCDASGHVVCRIGPSAAEIIRNSLEAGSIVGARFGDGLAAVWLTGCCVLVTLGWPRLWIRMLLAFVISLVCAFVPYFGPMLSIDHLINPNCLPNEGGVGPCMIYGGNVGSVAHDAVRLGWRIIEGASVALVIFVLYAVAALGMYLYSKRKLMRSSD